MVDNMSKENRSKTMSRIRSKGNASTELKMVQLLDKNKIQGWQRDYKLLGKPDFVFENERIAVFIDGCFWHGCPKCFQMPKSNTEYWQEKIHKNKLRAKKVNKELELQGWKVLRFWEHSFKRPTYIIKKIIKSLNYR